MNTGLISELESIVDKVQGKKLKPVSPNDFPLIDPKYVELYEACRVVGAALDTLLTCGVEPNPRTLALQRLAEAVEAVRR